MLDPKEENSKKQEEEDKIIILIYKIWLKKWESNQGRPTKKYQYSFTPYFFPYWSNKNYDLNQKKKVKKTN